jgi:regulator of replication initiation timing
MEQTAKQIINTEADIKITLAQVKQYLEKTIDSLGRENEKKDLEIIKLRQQLDKTKETMDGNSQLINKLLGDLSKLQNDIDWYKRTYERRSFLGTIRQKLFNKEIDQ